MKNILKLICISVTIITLSNSCGIEKRKYRSGYNIDWNNSKTVHSKKEIVENNQFIKIEEASIKKTSTENSIYETTLASSNNSDIITDQTIKKSNDSINSISEDCDLIILKNGEEIKAKVSEISKEEIKYKKCQDTTGFTYALKKSEVFEIKYPNGTKDFFTQEKRLEKTSKPKEEEKSGMFGILSLVFFCLGFLVPFLFIPSLVFAIIGIEKNRKNRSLAIATLVLFGLSVILIFIALLAWSGDI